MIQYREAVGEHPSSRAALANAFYRKHPQAQGMSGCGAFLKTGWKRGVGWGLEDLRGGKKMAPACTGPQCSIRRQGAALKPILYRDATAQGRDASPANLQPHQMWLPATDNRGHLHTGVLRPRRGRNAG